MKILLTHKVGNNKAGETLDVSDRMAKHLISFGWGKVVEDKIELSVSGEKLAEIVDNQKAIHTAPKNKAIGRPPKNKANGY